MRHKDMEEVLNPLHALTCSECGDVLHQHETFNIRDKIRPRRLCSSCMEQEEYHQRERGDPEELNFD